jgi:meso-butanediol dehydrogenase / (S,S)-butanediol dehydrogenase / diacetyl reductase
MSEAIDLDGQVVIVTGGGRGVGRGISERFLEAGAQVVVCSRRQPEKLPASDEGEAAFVACDVREPEAIERAVAEVAQRYGRLDVLVNNAGVIVTKLVADTTAAEWQRCNDVMGLGTFLCSKRAVEVMARQGAGGRIVNISSISGKRGNPYFGAYTFAKFGIIGLTQTLAAEVAHLGITVNAVCPGTVETDMIDQVRADRVAHGRPEVPPWAQPIPLGRLASAADIAAVVAFLASPEAGYVTGEAINVDGGRVMH